MGVRQPTTDDICIICRTKLVKKQTVLPCAYGCATYVCLKCLDDYPDGQSPYNQKCPTCKKANWVGDPVKV